MRFLLVRGKAALLVANPHVEANPRRYAGQTMIALPDDADGHHHERFEPCEEVIADDPSLRSAVAHGDLELLRECVAKTHAKAALALKGGDL